MNVTVVLGAGASHDCHAGTTPVRSELWQPPLANTLFNEKRFYRLGADLPSFPGIWSSIATQLSSRGTTNSFEAALSEWAKSAHPVRRAAFKSIPTFLMRLLASATIDYVDHPDATSLLVRGLLDAFHRVTFVVLNYDLILETALFGLGHLPPVDQLDMDDYNLPKGSQFQIYKIHGSCNWIAPFSASDSSSPRDFNHWISLVNQELDLTTWSPLNSVRVVPLSQLTFDRTKQHGIFINVGASRYAAGYPVLTAPLLDKSLDDVLLPTVTRNSLADCLSETDIVLAIGTSGLDADLMELMRTHAKSVSSIRVISKSQQSANEALARFMDNLPEACRANADAIAGGLSQFVTGPRFEEFRSNPSQVA
ncbi:MAG: hypothetical protein ACKVVT_09190 [Dehalococcoidia bacterium]